jgi:hypothetical protein
MSSVADDASERSSATKEIPRELRGRRVLTRLAGLASELREQGREPRVVHLTGIDESAMLDSASDTFGPSGLEAAREGREAWRAFLANWLRVSTALALVFDAAETRVE